MYKCWEFLHTFETFFEDLASISPAMNYHNSGKVRHVACVGACVNLPHTFYNLLKNSLHQLIEKRLGHGAIFGA